MIRDRLKSAVKKVALRAFNMEWDAEETRDGGTRHVEKVNFDPTKIPKVVDGSGDTPGPNHKEDIGRPWVSATLAGGGALVFVDIRPANEVTSGLLPSAMLLPGDSLKSHLDRLPEKDIRVTIYDQTGEQGSEALAAWLRGQGWTMARRLRGGFAEWIEHGEVVHLPQLATGAKAKVGDPIRLKDGRSGWVQEVSGSAGALRYTVWQSGGGQIGPVGEDALV